MPTESLTRYHAPPERPSPLLAGSTDPLTRTEERAAFARLQAGDEDAQDEIVCANVRFVMQIARQYVGGPLAHRRRASRGRGRKEKGA